MTLQVEYIMPQTIAKPISLLLFPHVYYFYGDRITLVAVEGQRGFLKFIRNKGEKGITRNCTKSCDPVEFVAQNLSKSNLFLLYSRCVKYSKVNSRR